MRLSLRFNTFLKVTFYFPSERLTQSWRKRAGQEKKTKREREAERERTGEKEKEPEREGDRGRERERGQEGIMKEQDSEGEKERGR